MSDVIRSLLDDHRNVAGLLNLLERRLDTVENESAGHADIELMRDIMTYMTRFPDHTHHPKEDRMFERMRTGELTPETGQTIDKLLREHGALAKKGEAFRRALLRTDDAGGDPRRTLLEMGRDYVQFLRYHMRLEEETVFAEAETLLDDTDWSEVEDAFKARTDPVFGPVVDGEFRALYQHIQNNAYLMARREA